MNNDKPKSRQYLQQLKNIAMGLCAHGKTHEKPVDGHSRCDKCIERNRAKNRSRGGHQPYGVTGRGRPTLGTSVEVANARKIARLEQSRAKHVAWIVKIDTKLNNIFSHEK